MSEQVHFWDDSNADDAIFRILSDLQIDVKQMKEKLYYMEATIEELKAHLTRSDDLTMNEKIVKGIDAVTTEDI